MFWLVVVQCGWLWFGLVRLWRGVIRCDMVQFGPVGRGLDEVRRVEVCLGLVLQGKVRRGFGKAGRVRLM